MVLILADLDFVRICFVFDLIALLLFWFSGFVGCVVWVCWLILLRLFCCFGVLDCLGLFWKGFLLLFGLIYLFVIC